MRVLCCLLSALVFSNAFLGGTVWDMKPEEVREIIDQKIMAIDAKRPEVHSVSDTIIEMEARKTALRIYLPNANKELPLILMIHGGGWVAGSIETHDNMARYLCQKTEMAVASVGYTNSPEGKFPLPLEQCYDALVWGTSHFKGAKVAVVGDSAGGLMAAALCQLARDRNGPPIGLQVLINPGTDLTCNGTLEPQNEALDTMRWFATQYVQNATDVYNPYVSPLLSSDLKNLPTALILLAENDPQRPEGQKYADLLRLAGVKTNTYIQWNMGHLAGNAARAGEKALESLDVAVAQLRGSRI